MAEVFKKDIIAFAKELDLLVQWKSYVGTRQFSFRKIIGN